MNAELDAYRHELCWILDEISMCLEGLTAEQLQWRPSTLANSPAAIASHVCASTRVYALGFGCGLAVSRDRPAEFISAATRPEQAISPIRHLQIEIEQTLAELQPSRLDERFQPPPDLWGTPPRREVSRRQTLLESIRHAALHLGELRLTRDLARASQAEDTP